MYYDRDFAGRRPESPCYESRLFSEWKFSTGWYHHGARKGSPIKAYKVREGDVAVFTTRFPGNDEVNRSVVGLFLIRKAVNAEEGATTLYADSRLRVRLPLDEAKALKFWDLLHHLKPPRLLGYRSVSVPVRRQRSHAPFRLGEDAPKRPRAQNSLGPLGDEVRRCVQERVLEDHWRNQESDRTHGSTEEIRPKRGIEGAQGAEAPHPALLQELGLQSVDQLRLRGVFQRHGGSSSALGRDVFGVD
jgi:hypothetical protein